MKQPYPIPSEDAAAAKALDEADQHSALKIPFGRHAGWKVRQLPTSYLLWLLSQPLLRDHRPLFIAVRCRALGIIESQKKTAEDAAAIEALA